MALAYPAVDNNAPVRRQNIAAEVDAQVPSMSDGNGNVIPFDSTKVKAAAANKA
ncbi:hypothetical protein N657DRAFT_680561 [Parathielavia appendiculata]|uniref:Uncharacterized protein n=1 Tax=Parathielavia appendiculata TaxID=2587402 RepID=A0AAN6Z4G0_9PEZI|nr:hypothetical protein N657DRAFT_680561 [Parathielavia appendiculata]